MASVMASAGYVGALSIIIGVAPAAMFTGPPQGAHAQWLEAAALASVILPSAASAWWLFRRLQQHLSRRMARAAAIAFGVVTPVSLGIALAVAPVGGGYAEGLFGAPYWGLIGALVTTFAIATVLTVAACLLAIRVVRVEEADQLSSSDSQ
jgi:hypothetical protein